MSQSIEDAYERLMNTQLLIIRGLPGSGKSTLADSLQKKFLQEVDIMSGVPPVRHYEADMYFVRPDGLYDFNLKYISRAHQWCQRNVRRDLCQGCRVIVSNTFTTRKEIKPYIDFAEKEGFPYDILTCTGDYGSIHDVPEETLKRMKARWQDL